jgi:hypothetical protein
MSWGGKRAGAGRKTDKPNRRRNVQCRLDGELFEVFTFYCRLLELNRSTTLEHLMETWIEKYQGSVQIKLGQMKSSLEELDPFALAELTQNLEKSSALLLRLAGVHNLEELRKRS